MDKFHPGHFGKVGMRHFHLKRNTQWCPTINVDKLWSLVSDEVREAAAASKDGKAPVIDITKYGYHKLLGSGPLPNIPVVVKAKFFSSKAAKKIAEVGGACVLIA